MTRRSTPVHHSVHAARQPPARHPTTKWAILGVVTVGTFLSPLDASIANITVED